MLVSEFLSREGVETVKNALEGFAGQTSDEEWGAAVDLVACRVIAVDTARIKAHAVQQRQGP